MGAGFPKVLTVAEVAEIIRSAVADVEQELAGGRLRGFLVGSVWRVTEGALHEFIEALPVPPVQSAVQCTQAVGADRGSIQAQWTPRAEFSYKWPDSTTETYDIAFESEVALPTGRYSFVIGYAWREAIGMKRRRVVVFLGRVPKLEPLVEFVGANDFEQSGHLVSIIKNCLNKQVPSLAEVPEEYHEIPTCFYSSMVVGPNAWKGVAVVADANDRDLMLRHAVIRARYKGRIPG